MNNVTIELFSDSASQKFTKTFMLYFVRTDMYS